MQNLRQLKLLCVHHHTLCETQIMIQNTIRYICCCLLLAMAHMYVGHMGVMCRSHVGYMTVDINVSRRPSLASNHFTP
jgi:hypothetical protein